MNRCFLNQRFNLELLILVSYDINIKQNRRIKKGLKYIENRNEFFNK